MINLKLPRKSVIYSAFAALTLLALIIAYRWLFSTAVTGSSPDGSPIEAASLPASKQFTHRVVHLDLKGAPPKMSYLMQLLPWLKKLGATGLLIEYEDMYPYSGDFSIVSRKDCYTEDEIKKFLAKADELRLTTIPLVQTFGHLEFVLKHERFAHLRAVSRDFTSLCASNPDSATLAKSLVDDVMRLHPHSRWIHVGGDEVGGIGECSTDNGLSHTELYIKHMKPILEHVKSRHSGVTPLLWHDMLAHWNHDELAAFSRLAEPMIWEYRTNVSRFVSRSTLVRFSATFSRVWAASAFKGADGSYEDFTPIKNRIANHVAWSDILKDFPGPGQLFGIALTGWSRYDHFSLTCELLPPAIPSLGLCMSVLEYGSLLTSQHTQVSNLLGFRALIPLDYFDVKYVEQTMEESGAALLPTYPAAKMYKIVTKLERLRSVEKACKRLEIAWVSPWQKKTKHLNWFRVRQAAQCFEDVAAGLEEMSEKATSLLGQFLRSSDAEEWVQTKLIGFAAPARETAKKMQQTYEGLV